MLTWSRVHGAFWRATLHCLHPRVLWLTLLPLLISSLMLGLAWWLAGDQVLTLLRSAVDSLPLMPWIDAITAWLSWPEISTRIAQGMTQALVLLMCLCLVVVVALGVVSATLSPALVSLVAQSRFPDLQSRQSVPWWQAAWWSLAATFVALVWLTLSLPLWLLPLGSVLVPPLIWGWLTCRVLAHDALAEHATDEERATLLSQYRWPLWFMGVASAYLGAMPAHLLMLAAWTTGALGGLAAGTGWTALNAVAGVAVPLALGGAVWIYTLVFAWSSLWFTHFLLEALAGLRRLQASSGMSVSSSTYFSHP